MKAFWGYYLTINCFSFLCSAIGAAVSGIVWFPIIFSTVGIPAGLLAYNTFFKNQYYFYYNLGYTRKKLAGMVFIYNCALSLPLLLLLVLL